MGGLKSEERRIGTRYAVHLPVRVEWDDESVGGQVRVEGETQNVGPKGALVYLRRLPQVGSRVRLAVLEDDATRFEAVAEVLRLERDPAQPLAALRLLDAEREWGEMVWEWAAQLERQAEDEETE
ncbi:MAG: hypothetical protein C4336_09975 [Armatimonadota bacterium]|uniref:PilZ domain-containing protein n=1 Tax=Pyrinomonas sp. TaxID=2080306 RepID=UPI00332C4D77